MVAIFGEPAIHRRDEVHDVRIALECHELRDPHRTIFADAAEIVAPEVHQHDVLGSFFLVAFELFCHAKVFVFVRPAGSRARDRVRSAFRPSTRTSISGDEPTIARPLSRMKYMYGDGLT